MSNFVCEARLIKDSIEQLTKKMFDKVIAQEMVDVNPLIDKRSHYIIQLIAHYDAVEDKSSLIAYLNKLKDIDQDLILMISTKREAVKNAIQNVEKLKEYGMHQ